jgi:hypothetical protein
MRTPIFCVVVCLGSSVVLAQGLGDAARKEQEKRKKAAESGDKAKAPAYGNAELLEAPKGKGTFSANVADTSGDSEVNGPVVGGTGSMPTASIAAHEGHVQPTVEGPEQSDMDRFKANLARWRAKFQPLKAEVDALEGEVKDLEAKASRSSAVGAASGTPIRDAYGVIVGYQGEGGGGGPRPLHEGEAARMRLPGARRELAAAKAALADVESQARSDGIAPGQLY